MARYLIEHGTAGTADYWFKGWDKLRSRVTEATDPAALGETMVHGTTLTFESLAPGERRVIGTTRRRGRELPVSYFRVY